MENVLDKPARKPFLPMMALVDPAKGGGYPMRFLREERISNLGRSWDDGYEHLNESFIEGRKDWKRLLVTTTRCEAHEAVLFLRPYVRILEGDVKPDAKVGVKVEESWIGSAPFSELLIADMKDPGLDQPFRWRQPLNWDFTKNVFPAGLLAEDGVRKFKGPCPFFVPRYCSVEVFVSQLEVLGERPARIEVGIVAATYTTDGIKTSHSYSSEEELH